MHERREAAAHHAANAPAVRLDMLDAPGGADRLDGRIGGKLHLDLVNADLMQLGDARHPDQPPGPDDPDAITDVFNLRQDVRRPEDRGTTLARFLTQLV